MDRLPPAGHHLRRRDYAKRRGWTVSIEANEVGSGTNTRPKREEILKAARRRELDAVVVWRLDRWGRSLIDLIGTLQELDGLGVGFVSLSEALDMTTPSGRALAVFAEFERDILKDRVRAGIAEARKAGRRPPWTASDRAKAFARDSSAVRRWRQQTGNCEALGRKSYIHPPFAWYTDASARSPIVKIRSGKACVTLRLATVG